MLQDEHCRLSEWQPNDILTCNWQPFLTFAFSIASKTAIFSAEDSLTDKYAALVSHKMAVLGHNFSFSQMNISMDVRPKGYGRTSIGSMHVRPKGVWTYVLRCLHVRP